ncbi:EF-P beta-lysylation protein EpmB [Kineobactrum sediminis]|uniref:L-lysine 2,3-aminomutase n=2 Tax=Kineobactrum sediminis TaxID=1905677 RepID=A0A2N5Y5M8_9GAMM|nr:EF-P beta-lysylation protein EpmB [Kineobactrum sediminis]PLW83703.1 EF-P beta-lysylation protein EpmB [Kineobactrum sediminis]
MPDIIALAPAPPEADWRAALRDLVTSADTLLDYLQLQPEQVGWSPQAASDFPLRVPRDFMRRMVIGDPADPLLLQVLAGRQELLASSGFGPDPIGETGTANPQPGIIHKYHGRLLLLVTGSCAIHCRYCFRRHFPYSDNQNSRSEWPAALQYIAADDSISEVIFSGGDPLVASDRQLAELVGQLAAIPHVTRLRIHTRLPVIIPQRVTDSLLEALTDSRLATVMVVHSNHANEIDEEVAAAFGRIRKTGMVLLNQSVLLAGINDNAAVLAALSERLFLAGALPYYLHLLDKVAGAAHFDVDESRAKALHREISTVLPGYLLPKLVREIAGAPAKVPV